MWVSQFSTDILTPCLSLRQTLLCTWETQTSGNCPGPCAITPSSFLGYSTRSATKALAALLKQLIDISFWLTRSQHRLGGKWGFCWTEMNPRSRKKNSLSRKVTCCTNEKRQTFKKKCKTLSPWDRAQRVERAMLVCRADYLSSISGSHKVAAENQLPIEELSFEGHHRAASPPVNKVLQIKGKNVKTPLGWAAHSPLKTLVAQRACSSTVGKMEPRGWMSPMHARVGFSSWGGNMYLYSGTLLPSTFTSESSRNGKEKV